MTIALVLIFMVVFIGTFTAAYLSPAVANRLVYSS
jgi:hypothetical protein